MSDSSSSPRRSAVSAALRQPEMVLIDLDGTLVDSVPDLAYCVDGMMEQLGLPRRGEQSVRQWVGNGVERLVRRALSGSLDGETDEALFQRALPLFEALYAEHYCVRSYLYPGVREGLAFLKRAGYKVGCVTNKPEAFTLPLLKAMDIYGDFGVVVSGDSLPQRKPHPMPLIHAAERLGARPMRSLMIGDSINDVAAARAAAFQVVCVTYGYNHGEDIGSAHPEALIDSLAELEYLLEAAPPWDVADVEIT